MRLKRRFNWDDRTTTYARVNEDEVEKAKGGMIRFVAIATDGRSYEGVAFEPTVADMTLHDYWKLAPNPNKPEKSIVVEAKPRTEDVIPNSEKPSTETEPAGKAKTRRG